MNKLILMAISAIASSFANAAYLETSIQVGSPIGDAVGRSVGVQARSGFDEGYLWASASTAGLTLTTQAPGVLQTIAAGVGKNFDNGFFVEVGYAQAKLKVNQEIALKEGIYYQFIPNFGHPPFLTEERNYFGQLSHAYELKNDVLLRLGYSFEVAHDLNAEISYTQFNPESYFAIWNPDFGSPDNRIECGCYWEGQSNLNMSAFNVGASYKFEF